MKRAIASLFAVVAAGGLLAAAGCSPDPAMQSAGPVPVAVDPQVEPAPALAGPAQPMVRNDPDVINFHGYGPAKFGAGEEAVRMAMGHPLIASEPARGSTCYRLHRVSDPGQGISFMFEDGRFVRYDVDSLTHAAPEHFMVGRHAQDVMAEFAGRVEEQPHKYIEGGRLLVVRPPDGGEARLVFEIDPDGLVSKWRIGIPPQVHYVEGCG